MVEAVRLSQTAKPTYHFYVSPILREMADFSESKRRCSTHLTSYSSLACPVEVEFLMYDLVSKVHALQVVSVWSLKVWNVPVEISLKSFDPQDR